MGPRALADMDDLGERRQLIEVPEDSSHTQIAICDYDTVRLDMIHSGKWVCVEEARPGKRTQ